MRVGIQVIVQALYSYMNHKSAPHQLLKPAVQAPKGVRLDAAQAMPLKVLGR